MPAWMYRHTGYRSGSLCLAHHEVIDDRGQIVAVLPTEELARLLILAPKLLAACEALIASGEDFAAYHAARDRIDDLVASTKPEEAA